MFNFVFIRKYKKDVKGYIDRVYEPSALERAFMNAFSIPFGSSRKVVREEPKPSVEEDEVISVQKPMESVATAPKKPRSVGRYSINVSEVIQETAEREKDRFDAEAVSKTMQTNLEGEAKTSLDEAKNITFVEKLRQIIRKKDMLAPDVYKAAQMDRKLYSKILSNNDYTPSKDTVVAFIFALRLTPSEAKDLLERAGFTLSHSMKRDIIIEYFIKERVYNLYNINAFLHNMGEKVIGREY